MEVRNYPGLPHPLQQPARETSVCSGGGSTAPPPVPAGGLRPYQRAVGFWQPPGILLQTHSAE